MKETNKIKTGYRFPFEKRAYNHDSKTEELEAINNCVFNYSEDIIYLKEVPVVSELSVDICFDAVERLAKNMKKRGLLIDVTETQVPDSRVRRQINKRFQFIGEIVEHVSFWSGKNILINSVARFAVFKTNVGSFSIHKTQEAAINEIKKKLYG